MKIGKAVLAGVVAGVLRFIWGGITCGWLFNWVYKIEPVNIWKPMEEISLVLAMLVNIVFAVLFALVYAAIQKGLPGKGIVKGLWYGLFIWLVSALPGDLELGLWTTIAPVVINYWIISFLIVNLWSGVVVAAIYGRQE